MHVVNSVNDAWKFDLEALSEVSIRKQCFSCFLHHLYRQTPRNSILGLMRNRRLGDTKRRKLCAVAPGGNIFLPTRRSNNSRSLAHAHNGRARTHTQRPDVARNLAPSFHSFLESLILSRANAVSLAASSNASKMTVNTCISLSAAPTSSRKCAGSSYRQTNSSHSRCSRP